MKYKIYNVIYFIVLVIISVIITGSFFIRNEFPVTTFDELHFYLTNGVGNSDVNVFLDAIKTCLPYFLLLMIVFCFIFFDITCGRFSIKYHSKKRSKRDRRVKINKFIQIYPFRIIYKHRFILVSFLAIISLVIATYNLDFVKFIQNSKLKSEFVDVHYIDPKNTNVTFDQKRNLVLIFVESLETSFFSKDHGGQWEYDVIPELYNLTKDEDATVFYDKNKAKQLNMINGASWTTAALVTNTSGLTFKIPISGNQYHSENFMNGAYTLGDLLEKNGYHNELISGANTEFGGVKDYYTRHGNFKIIDYHSLDDNHLELDANEKNGWGFSDNYLFEIAKKRIKELSKNDQLFNLNLVTIDTHFPDGYLYDYSVRNYGTQYENVYATTSKLIYDFIEWLKEQDIYDNTTIVVMGDHLSMQTNYFDSRGIEERYVYCCYINSAVKPEKNNNRVYTALDTYPSIVAAIGGKIEGERLGLGVNLFSADKTLSERYGVKKVESELSRNSDFYNKKILGKDFEEMIRSESDE